MKPLRNFQNTSLHDANNTEFLMHVALEGPGKISRTTAVETLTKSSTPLPSSFLRKLFHSDKAIGRKKAAQLILDKGDEALIDVYIGIMKRHNSDRFLPKDAFKKIGLTADTETVREAFEICMHEDDYFTAAENLYALVRHGLTKKAMSVIEWCFEQGANEPTAILAAAEVPECPIELIKTYCHRSNPLVRASAWRAMERRKQDTIAYQEILALWEALKSAIRAKNNRSLWAGLSVIDGMLEFGEFQVAIDKLKKYYNLIDRLFDGKAFPLRAAWDRLFYLGIELEHPIYQDATPLCPHGWPTKNGPFYGLRDA